MKVLIVYKNPQAENPSACHAGLGVTAGNTVDVLVEFGLNAELFPVVDGYYLRDKLRTAPYADVTHVVLCAPFFDTGFLKALCGEFHSVQFSVVFHSNVGFLGVDNWSMGALGEQLAFQATPSGGNFHVAGNSEKFCEAVEASFNERCTLLPNLYFLHGPIERKRLLWQRSDPLRIGAFGATRVLKNLPTAAWAATILAQALDAQVEFWVSAGREEGAGGSTVMEGVRRHLAGRANCTLVEAPWRDWLDFRRTTVRKMNLLMQPSFTESFNGVTADGIAEGVPSVVGAAIDWVPQNWVANADDAVDVARVGAALLRDKNAPRDGYRMLVKHNERAISEWKAFLCK